MGAWCQSTNNDANPAGQVIVSYDSNSTCSDSEDDEHIQPSHRVVEESSSSIPNSEHGETIIISSNRPKSPEIINENTPLIPQYQNNDEEPSQDADPPLALTTAEFFLLIKTSVPVILAYTLQSSLQALSILIVGRISPAALSVAAFSYMFAMSTAFIVALGGTTALDTLASSTFTGSKNRTDLGILLQRAFVVLGVLYIPVASIWWFSGPIFQILGQEEYIVRDAPMFLRYLIPGGLGYVYFESLKKYLQAQGIMKAGTYVLLITSPINVLLNYLFIYTFGFGVNGAPMATSITYWLSFVLLGIYSKYIAGHECWGGWSTACFKNMFTFLRLALLGTIMVGTEWWAFEIVAIVAGRLGQIPLAAQSVIMTTDQVLNTIPFGIGVAASARVGNLLGAKDARGAARAANKAAWVSVFMGTVVLIVLMGVKDVYAKIFNDDEDVVRLTGEVMPYVALFQVADGLNGSCGGSLRGMGRQHVGAGVNIISYYVVALPLGIWLAYHGWGLAGLWVGQCLALYAVGIGEWLLVYFSDWDVQVINALDRLDDAERTEIGEARAMAD
ncbi:hypothetical protein AA313_de0205042 [Arthrobotrys entomopaga]|nr:hypothetical protein AA313_de0205042 [Arthrobotrys entomopaga]